MTLPPAYFAQMYAEHPDPWGFCSRHYEARKRALTMAVLPEDRYLSIFEPGCSIGVLTTALAERADAVLAMDVSEAALDTARETVPGHVELRLGAVPADWPRQQFDLVVLSEVGYYLDASDCQQVAAAAMQSGREVLAVHWRHPVEDYPLSGDDVHEILGATATERQLTRLVVHLERDLRIELWSHDARSVAARSGLVAV